jgi:hypothetical protein
MDPIPYSSLQLIAKYDIYSIFSINEYYSCYLLFESYSYIWEIENYYLIPKYMVSNFEPIYQGIQLEFWVYIKNIKENGNLKQVSVTY